MVGIELPLIPEAFPFPQVDCFLAFSIECVGYPDEIDDYLAKRKGVFHTTSDRFYAGIVMKVRSSGTTYSFRTAD